MTQPEGPRTNANEGHGGRGMRSAAERMPRRESATWLLLSLITMLYWLAPQSVRLLYAIRLAEFGASDLMIGLIVGGSTMVSLVLAVPSGYLLDKLDGRRVLLLSTLALAFVTLGFTWAPSPAWMAGLMLLQAVLSMWVWLVLQANITYVGGRPSAGRQLNAFSLAWGLGMAAGPVLVARVYDAASFEAMSVICFVMVLVGALASPFTPDVRRLRSRPPAADGSPHEHTPLGLRATFLASLRDPVIVPIMACGFVNVYVFSLRSSFYPVYLERIGISLSMVGVLLSVIGVTSLGIRVLLPLGVRRFGNVRLLIWSTWVVIVGLAMVPASAGLVLQVTAAVLIGVGLGSNPVISVNMLAGTRETAPGIAMGLRLLSNRAGQVTQPLVFGGVAGVASLGLAFPVSALLLSVTTLWVSTRLRRSVTPETG